MDPHLERRDVIIISLEDMYVLVLVRCNEVVELLGSTKAHHHCEYSVGWVCAEDHNKCELSLKMMNGNCSSS